MRYRKLGRTGIEVSEIGYGTWGIGGVQWLGATDEESLNSLDAAIDLGVNFIDTALAYGQGHSERLVGQAISKHSDRVYVATKVPPKNLRWPAPSGLHPSEAFPADHIHECTERSLRNLGLDAIDVQQLHVWQDDWVGQGDWLAEVENLKRAGKIRFFGISTNDNQPENAIKLVNTGLVDTVQVIYNIFEQRPDDRLFPACQEHAVGVIARVPFDEGALTGNITPRTTFDPDDFRAEYFRDDRTRQVDTHVEAIRTDLGIRRDELPEVALRFVLSNPAVSTVIPGMRSVRNVRRNTSTADGNGLPEERLRKLRTHRWTRNFYA
jgi:aryl-alcohol dehydrogenase-like predicted oxidoreductase